MNYFIKTYGCQMNIHESEKLAGILSQLGYVEGKDERNADILVFNTCCIRETAEQKIYGNLGLAKNYKKHNANMIVALVGCMTQQQGTIDTIKAKYPFVDIVLGTTNINLFAGSVKSIIDARKKTYDTTESDYSKVELPCVRTSYPNAWVNIIYGCNNFCTYCIVPYVRGREHSRRLDDVVEEVSQLIDSGYKEITLLGQNVNSYGKDLGDDTSFAKLLDKIAALPGKFRLRFMTSHPKDLTDDVIEQIAKHANICNYIHLPVQSGSNNILTKMNRKYTREQYLQLVEKIRTKIPGVGITTDIMVGFPGESDDDFADTLSLVEQCRYSSAFCFIYSRRKGTPAYDSPEQLPYSVKQKRIAQLLSTQNAITREISKTLVGTTQEVLVEDVNSKYANTYCGRIDNNRLVNFQYNGQRSLIGEFVQVVITEGRSATLWGTIKED